MSALNFEQVKSELEKQKSKDIPVRQSQQTSSTEASDIQEDLSSVSPSEKKEQALHFDQIEVEYGTGIDKSMVANCELFLNYLYLTLPAADKEL